MLSKNLFGMIFLFLFLFPFKFDLIPISNLYIIFFISLLYSLLKLTTIKINKKLFALFFLFSINILYFIFVKLFNSSDDFSNLNLAFVFFICYPVILYFILDCFYKKSNIKNILLSIIYVLFFQSLISILMYTIHPFRDLVFSIIDNNVDSINNLKDVRIIGIGTMYFGMGVILGYGLILISYCIRFFTFTKKEYLYLCFMYVIIFIAAFFSARTSIIPFFISLIMLFSFKKRTLKFFIYMISLCSILIITSYLLLPEPIINNISNKMIPWAFEMFINYFKSNEINTQSTDDLKTMYFSISNLNTFIFGDGYLKGVDGSVYYMGTDAGYMRQILSYGIIGSFIVYISYINIIKATINKIPVLKVLLIVTILYFFILNIKGLMFYYSAVDKIIILFFMCSILNVSRKNE